MNASITVPQPQQPATEPEVLAALVQSIVEDPRLCDPEFGLKDWQVERILRDRYHIAPESGRIFAIMELLGAEKRLEVLRTDICFGGIVTRVELMARPLSAGRESDTTHHVSGSDCPGSSSSCRPANQQAKEGC